ncbi:DNA polymerase III subunit delta' [Lentibacter algarum]|uniref:DNA polymerase III subunit delta' n=1 Tax=Lentibacter algarum TaxID=576131 RepID=UPI001C072FEE|nr:DNA polymerase III subunit delta' [Lentibacter algarum]MBU2981722.1 DNA polymerase III subunit delta' [Lentibacter algarum]
MADAPVFEPDRLEGAPHPRDAVQLYGQIDAEQKFLDAYNAGRLHHGWLLTGPKGVGKATLAWRLARFLLTQEAEGGLFGEPEKPTTLDVDAAHPVLQRMVAGSESRLFRITRTVNPDTKRMRDGIVVDDVRELGRFLSMSAAEGGRRVVIIDAADELNVQAANALLKMLEEPPALTTFLIIAHQPAGLLPTIRSRCRELRLATLSAENMAFALEGAGFDAGQSDGAAEALGTLSGGSVGAAARLLQLDGLALYSELIGVFQTLPQLERSRVVRLADSFAARGAEEKLDLLLNLLETLMFRLARAGAAGANSMSPAHPGEAELLTRLSPDAHAARRWAKLSDALLTRARHGRAVNLDPAALILDTFMRIQRSVAEQSAR